MPDMASIVHWWDNSMPCLASFFEDIFGFKKLAKFVLVIICPTSAFPPSVMCWRDTGCFKKKRTHFWDFLTDAKIGLETWKFLQMFFNIFSINCEIFIYFHLIYFILKPRVGKDQIFSDVQIEISVSCFYFENFSRLQILC